MLDVRRWAEIRRMKEVEGLSIHEIVRRTGHDRNTIRRALRRRGPPRYQRPPRPSKLDPFKDEIHRLLQREPRMPGKRIRELIEELGYEGGKTILDDYLREVRPLFARRRAPSAHRLPARRSASSTSGSRAARSRSAMARRVAAGSSTGCLAARARAPARWSSPRSAPTICLRDGALPCPARRAARDAGLGSRGRDPRRRRPARPTRSPASAASWRSAGCILEARDPQAKGALERSHRFMPRPTSSPAAASPTSLTTSTSSTRWSEKVNQRATAPTRAVVRRAPGRRARADAAAARADARRRPALRDARAAQPYLRVDTNDYSLDPRLVGRRVEVRVSQREVTAVALDTRRARRPPPAPLRAPPDDHRPPSTPARCAASARRGRGRRGRAAAAGPL